MGKKSYLQTATFFLETCHVPNFSPNDGVFSAELDYHQLSFVEYVFPQIFQLFGSDQNFSLFHPFYAIFVQFLSFERLTSAELNDELNTPIRFYGVQSAVL